RHPPCLAKSSRTRESRYRRPASGPSLHPCTSDPAAQSPRTRTAKTDSSRRPSDAPREPRARSARTLLPAPHAVPPSTRGRSCTIQESPPWAQQSLLGERSLPVHRSIGERRLRPPPRRRLPHALPSILATRGFQFSTFTSIRS